MHHDTGASKLLLIVVLILSMVFGPIPHVVNAEPPPESSASAVFVIVHISPSEAHDLLDSSLSPEKLEKRLIDLRDESQLITVDDASLLLDQVLADGQLVPAPTGPNGTPIPPPVKFLPGPQGQPNP